MRTHYITHILYLENADKEENSDFYFTYEEFYWLQPLSILLLDNVIYT